MVSKHRNRRLTIIGLCGLALALGVWMLGQALSSNTQFFYDPSEIAQPNFIAATPTIRIGGIVVDGSVRKGEGLFIEFDLKDFEGEAMGHVTIRFDGALPDLFREGQGIVVVGRPESAGIVKAQEVLAKHDENYTPAT